MIKPEKSKAALRLLFGIISTFISLPLISMDQPSRSIPPSGSVAGFKGSEPGFLEELDKNVDDLFLGIESDNVALVQSALAFGISPFAKQDDGSTAWDKAYQRGNSQIMGLLRNSATMKR